MSTQRETCKIDPSTKKNMDHLHTWLRSWFHREPHVAATYNCVAVIPSRVTLPLKKTKFTFRDHLQPCAATPVLSVSVCQRVRRLPELLQYKIWHFVLEPYIYALLDVNIVLEIIRSRVLDDTVMYGNNTMAVIYHICNDMIDRFPKGRPYSRFGYDENARVIIHAVYYYSYRSRFFHKKKRGLFDMHRPFVHSTQTSTKQNTIDCNLLQSLRIEFILGLFTRGPEYHGIKTSDSVTLWGGSPTAFSYIRKNHLFAHANKKVNQLRNSIVVNAPFIHVECDITYMHSEHYQCYDEGRAVKARFTLQSETGVFTFDQLGRAIAMFYMSRFTQEEAQQLQKLTRNDKYLKNVLWTHIVRAAYAQNAVVERFDLHNCPYDGCLLVLTR